MSKYDQFLEPKKPHILKAPAVTPEPRRAAKFDKKSAEGRVTVKVSETSFMQLKILKMATEENQTRLLSQAIQLYYDTISLENSKVKAFQTILEDERKPNETQMTFDEMA